MADLRLGISVPVEGLTGKWVTWSKSADAPGAYFVTPGDDEARAMGLKYAVIKSVNAAAEGLPTITLLRTDPHRPDLLPKKQKKGKKK